MGINSQHVGLHLLLMVLSFRGLNQPDTVDEVGN